MKTLVLSVVLASFTAHAGIKEILEPYIQKVLVLIMGDKKQGASNASELPAFPSVVKDPKDASQMSRVTSEFNHAFYQKLNEDQKAELSSVFLQELYLVVLGREPRSYEINPKMSVLMQGASREGVYRSVVLSNDYRSMELTEQEADQKVIAFAANYLTTYLNLQADEKKLSKINFYTIKRILVDRSFELLDAYPSQQDAHQWFAVLSRDLNKNYPQYFESNHRRYGEISGYKAWANVVPMDIVKGEVFYKVHKVINNLQLGK